ncbi:MAG TPA: tripartite tricarboxylate transporter substrate binding protein [Chthoniobacterales bacterium]|nr:tripartite tricarboxylate transporter substrate binding protein [Chthoniobacterales bacterium]
MRMLSIAAGAALAAATALIPAAHAQEYPTRPIRVIVPFSPGTGSDVLGRVLAQKLSEQLGQTVVIDNRPGGSGAMGTDMTARAAPDGYTLTLATNATLVTFPLLSPSAAKYKADKDFTPISFFARTSMMVITANTPATPKTIGELVSTIKAKPVTFASNGAGTIGHLVTEAFLLNQNLKATHVAYKGSGNSHPDVLRGEVLFMTDTPAAALGNIRAGRFRALAITGDSRLDALPDVPTFEESGIKNMNLYAWWGIFGPVGMQKNVVQKLDSEIRKAVQSPDVKARLRSLELQEFLLPPEKYTPFLQGELRYWQAFLKQTGIRLD